MKKLTTLLLAAGMIFAASAPASAVDVKVDGTYKLQFTQGSSIDFAKDGSKFDRAHQQVDLGMTFAASENVSGYFQVRSYWDWGRNNYGGADGGYAFSGKDNDVYMRQAYIDWIVPQTTVKVRMGRQNIGLPALADGKNIAIWAKDPVDGITVSSPVTDWLSLSAFWARYAVNQSAYGHTYDTHGSEKLDAFGLVADMNFDGFKITPFLAYAATGDKITSTWTNTNSPDLTEYDHTNYYAEPEFDATTGEYKDAKKLDTPVDVYKNKHSTANNTYWAGITGTMTYFDPFVLKASFVYGDRDYTSKAYASQHGYFAEASAAYKTAYGTPELLAFYGSGDDKDVEYAYQETLPSVGGRFKGSYAFFNGSGLLDNEAQNGHSPAGMWGVRLGMTGISFLQDLSHSVAVVYAQGTNAKQNAEFGLAPNKYMTTKDSMVEFDFSTTYNIYKNLSAYLEAAYVLENFETKDGGSFANRASSYDDAWKVALMFQYKF